MAHTLNDFSFCYETKFGREFDFTADIEFDEDGGCVGCDWPGCIKCPSNLVIDSAEFFKGKRKVTGKQADALFAFLKFRYEEQAAEAYNSSHDEY